MCAFKHLVALNIKFSFCLRREGKCFVVEQSGHMTTMLTGCIVFYFTAFLDYFAFNSQTPLMEMKFQHSHSAVCPPSLFIRYNLCEVKPLALSA